MYAYKTQVSIPSDHQLHLSLPAHMPVGKAEIVILMEEEGAGATEVQAPPSSWIDELLATVPPAPNIPLAALSRESFYDEDGR
jgi:hypothetical protein